MTTDDQKLTELLAQKLHEVDPISGHAPRWDRLLKMDREWYRIKAAAVLPILRRAQADAWDEGAQAQADTYGGQIDTGPNPYRTEQTNG